MKFSIVPLILPALATAFVLPSQGVKFGTKFADSPFALSSTTTKEVLAPLDVKDEFKSTEFNTMLQCSAIVYSYTEVRNIVKKYSKTLNPDFDEAVEFDQPELVVTQMATEQNPFDGTFLKYPVNAKGIHKFIELNQKYLVGDDDSLAFNPEGDGSADFDGDGIVDLPIMKRLKQFEAIDADIIEFDDEFVAEGLGSELVFCIILNRTEKRVTVIFRGSVTVKDWLIDLSALKTTPDEIKEFGGRRVDIHAGFSKYMFGKTNEDKNQFEQIVYILKQVFSKEEYADYDIFVTGHSLGGALAQLLAFALAGSPDAADLPKPINAITYASPRVGNRHYLNKYKELEADGKLRHIRVSNSGDMVCVAPSVGYRQTGLNIHVREGKKATTKYCGDRNVIFQTNLKAAKMHSLDVYHKRLFIEENVDDLGLSVEELYKKYVFTD